MEEIGVMAVVKELSKFQGDMGSIDSAIAGIVPSTGLLGSALSGLGNIAQSVGGWIADTLAHAVGELLADAVEWATQKIWEMVEGSLAIADQFQALEIRLKQLNFNDATASGMEYTDAMKLATDQTKEQLDWIQKLAFATPFEMEDITNVYGMARAFGYTDEGARDLTTTLGDFVFGMGLTGDAANSIVKQFGQMNSTGKIMQKNLNALAQGGMVPVTKLLDIMKEKTGLSEAEFKKFLLTAEGVTMFKQTFSDFVENNFAGAGERANRTFKNASITLKEFFQTLLAGNVVTPIIAQIGETIAKVNDALQARLPQIQDAFGRIGKVIADFIAGITGKADVNSFADGFVSALQGIATWLEGHKDVIVNFFKGAKDFITDVLIPKLRELTDWLLGRKMRGGGRQAGGFLEKMWQTLKDMQPLLKPVGELVTSLLKIGAAVFSIDLGQLGDKSFAENVKLVADQISNLAKFLSDNAATIGVLIRWFFIFQIALTLVGSIISAVIGFVVSAVSAFYGWYIIVSTLTVVFDFLIGVLGSITLAGAAAIAPFIALGLGVAWVAYMIYKHGEEMWTTIQQMVFLIGYYLGLGLESFNSWIVSVGESISTWVSDTVGSISTWGENVVNSVSTTWSQLGFIIGYYAGLAWDAIKEWAVSTWESIEEWGRNLWDSISNTWSQLGFIISYYAGLMWQSIVDAFNRILDSIRDKLVEIKDAMSTNWFSVGAEWVQGMINGVWDKVGALADSVWRVAFAAYQAAMSLDWFGVGINMIQGMINGLWHMVGALADAAWNVAYAAYESALNALGINSPSKLFIEIGTNTVQGFIDGLDNAAGAAAKAMQGVVSGVVSVGAMTPSMAASAAPSYVSSTTNNNNYNLNINSSASTEPIISDFNLMQSLQSG